MVHALEEIWRVLIPDGKLIDLRPLAGDWPLEVVSSRATQEAGRVTDLPAGLEDDAAAGRAAEEAAAAGWFRRESQEFFPFHYYWDSPKEMQAYVEEEWQDFMVVSEEVWKTARSLWAVAEADAQLRVRLRMLITRWRK